MKRPLVFASMCALALAATVAAASPGKADPVVYVFAAIPGPASNCQWFDENLDNRSEGALYEITQLLYNRITLQPGTPITVTSTESTSRGEQVVGFQYDRRIMCAGKAAITPPTPEPPPTPTPVPTPLPIPT
jgi:hypothetical protein